jgi:hypothetical protein
MRDSTPRFALAASRLPHRAYAKKAVQNRIVEQLGYGRVLPAQR